MPLGVGAPGIGANPRRSANARLNSRADVANERIRFAHALSRKAGLRRGGAGPIRIGECHVGCPTAPAPP